MKSLKPFKGHAKISYYTSWVLGHCDGEIVEYYRWWYKRKKGIVLLRPKDGAHISIVRGKEENIENGWWEINIESGEVVPFWYSPELREDQGYVWIDVDSEELEKIRLKLGLVPCPPFGYHITIGRLPI